MLAPDDRSVLTDLLRPPPNFHLGRAVGTTFSVDLRSAVAIPLAFASHRMTSTQDPIAILDAVRRASDRVDVFHQAGQALVPSAHSDLFAFIEPMIHGARAPRAGHLFHPKVWVLRYDPDEDTADEEVPRFRVVCQTRNLTNDSSWDAVAAFDGTSGGRRAQSSNRPLRDFIAALPGLPGANVPPERTDAIRHLADEVSTVVWDLPEGVHDLTFHLLGISAKTAKIDFASNDHQKVIVAPFCNNVGVERLIADTRGHIVLVGESPDLSRLDPRLLERVEAKVFSAAADLGPDELPEQGSDGAESAGDPPPSDRTLRSNLHAKITVLHRGHYAHVFLGSANATSAAYEGNVEFLVELKANARAFGVKAFLGDDGVGSLLEPFDGLGGEPPDPVDEALRSLKNVVRRAAEQVWTISVQGPAPWELQLSSAPIDLPSEIRLTAALLTRPGEGLVIKSGATSHGTWSGVETPDITPFVALRAETTFAGQTLRWASVVRARVIDDPADRLDAVLARQVDTPEKLLRFILLILGLDRGELPSATNDGDGTTIAFAALGGSTGLFEGLVRILVEHPHRFDDVDGVISRLRATDAGRELLGEEFASVWDAVRQARDHLANEGGSA